MTLTRFASVLVLAVLPASASALVGPSHAAPGAPSAPVDGPCSVTVRVLHAGTGQGLSGLPVFITSTNLTGALWLGVSDDRGEWEVHDLPEGHYIAWVRLHTTMSIVRFDTAGEDHATVTILFNPDFD